MAANSQSWPTVADWVERLAPRREGKEWKCPCPLCGGDDRFHIGEKPNGEALVGCRVCMDGQPDGQRRFIEAVRQVFPERYPLSQGQPRTRQDGQPTVRRRLAISDQRTEGKAATTPAQAAAIWQAGVEATGSLAHTYLAGRLAWPPAECGHLLPRTVAFLPKAVAPPYVHLPRGCAGAVVFRLESAPGELQAVQLEALDSHGRRLRPQRFRRTFGPLTDAWFRVDVDRPAGVVVEGPVDALAAVWLWPGLAAWATCGTAGLASLTAPKIRAAGWQGPVKIISDPDAKGRTAAREAEAALNRAGWDVELTLRPDNTGDVADELAGAIEERGAIVEHDGGVSAAQAICVAWESFIQKGEK